MRCQMADGNMVWHGRCTKTGKEVKIYYEKFTCLDGTWKPVSKEGGQRLTQYLGKSLSHVLILTTTSSATLSYKETIELRELASMGRGRKDS